MKKQICAALFGLSCLPAMADWTSLGDVGNAELFVDPTTVVHTGDMATMWSIFALKEPAKAGTATYVSLKRQMEFDCKGSRLRDLQISAYPEAMAEGTAVATEKATSGWTDVTPGSTGEKLWKVACGGQ